MATFHAWRHISTQTKPILRTPNVKIRKTPTLHASETQSTFSQCGEAVGRKLLDIKIATVFRSVELMRQHGIMLVTAIGAYCQEVLTVRPHTKPSTKILLDDWVQISTFSHQRTWKSCRFLFPGLQHMEVAQYSTFQDEKKCLCAVQRFRRKRDCSTLRSLC